MALRIDSQGQRKAQQQVPYVAVQQADNTKPQEHEERALEYLECPNNDQPAVVTLPRPAMLHI